MFKNGQLMTEVNYEQKVDTTFLELISNSIMKTHELPK